MSETVKPFTDVERDQFEKVVAAHVADDCDWVLHRLMLERFSSLLARLAAAEDYAEAGRALLYDDHKLSAEEMFRRFEIARKKWLATRGIGI